MVDNLMKIAIYTVALSILCLGLTSCRGSSQAPRKPPAAASPVSQSTLALQPMNVISIRLNKIQLTERALDRNINLDTVWMIPLNVESEEGMGARFQYIEEGRTVEITNSTPYQPSTPWFISVEKSELYGKDFGIWIMLTSSGDAGEFVKDEFVGLVEDALPFVVSGGVTAVLSSVTPMLPDELVPATSTATRGFSLMGRISALGNGLRGYLERGLQNTARDFTSLSVEDFAGSLHSAATAVSYMGYFGEVYITFSAADNYRLNNNVSVVTTDGSLLIEFSIFETTNNSDMSFTNSQVVESYLPLEECNSQSPSVLFSGEPAIVIAPRLDVFESPLDSAAQEAFTIFSGDIVNPIIPYCNQSNNVLWWRICQAESECGWIAESQGSTVFVEAVGDST